MYYVLAICASVCFAMQFVMMKLYQRHTANNLTSALVFSALSSALGLLVFLCVNRFRLGYTDFTLILSVLLGLFMTLSTVTSIKILNYGKLSVYSMFMMLGGMALPYVFGLIAFSEQLTVLKLVGMVLLVISLVLTSREKTSQRVKRMGVFLMLCAAVFVLNGSVSVVSALQGRATEVWQLPTTDIIDFVIWSRIWTVIFSLAAVPLVFAKKREQRQEELVSVRAIFKPKPLLAGLGFTIVSTLGFYLQLICTPYVDSSVLFPITTGGTVVLSTLFGLLFFKEKPSVLVWICISVTTVATVLFALGDVFPLPIF